MVVTIAGNGTAGSTGDGGDALKASIYVDTGLTTDLQGNVYISEFASNRIRRVSPDGIIATIAGTGDYRSSPDGTVAAKSPIKSPEGLLFDPAGNLLFAELNNHLIRMITPDGILIAFNPRLVSITPVEGLLEKPKTFEPLLETRFPSASRCMLPARVYRRVPLSLSTSIPEP